jgi:DNA-binding GntR family transcriptional regulator
MSTSSDPTVSPIGNRPEPAYATIYTVLRDHLDRKALPAGLVLGQANVARAFNVSRVPAGIALSRLHDEGMIYTFEGRGYIVPHGEPVRMDLAGAGLSLPPEISAPAVNRREQIYVEVEHTVAVCLAYGRFMLNETALAAHYDVSRTIAHEVLTQLERAGIVEQDSNNRWYAGPLRENELEQHYEIRWLLEPQALKQAFPRTRREDIEARLGRIRAAEQQSIRPPELELLETDLHIHTLAPCPNAILLNTVRRSLRILIATHSTFANHQDRDELGRMVAEHKMIYEALMAEDVDLAASILEVHLRRSVKPNLEMLQKLGLVPEAVCPPYLVQVR